MFITRSARKKIITWPLSEVLEQTIQRRILKNLKSRGIFAIKVIHANKNGCPDILACHNGAFIGIEVKTSTGVVSPVQAAQLKYIEAAGGVALVARCWEDVKELLDGKNV